MDLNTILKAIEIVGAGTRAGTQLYQGFMQVTTGSSREALETAYTKAMARSDSLHDRMRDWFGG